MKKLFRKQKANGSSIYMYIPIIFLLIWILIFVNIYLRAADTVSDNYKTSLDAANLSITLVNTDVLLHKGRIGIVALSEEGSTTNMTNAERNKVQSLFEIYERVLQSNIGLNNDFSFQGGTCGWASNILASGGLTIDDFIIYDIAPDDTIYAYRIYDVSNYTVSPSVSKNVAGKLTRDAGGNITGTNVRTPENILVTDCTLYTSISFPMEAPGITRFPWVNYNTLEDGVKEFINGEKRASTSSTTSLKTSNAFGNLNGNGWFQ